MRPVRLVGLAGPRGGPLRFLSRSLPRHGGSRRYPVRGRRRNLRIPIRTTGVVRHTCPPDPRLVPPQFIESAKLVVRGAHPMWDPELAGKVPMTAKVGRTAPAPHVILDQVLLASELPMHAALQQLVRAVATTTGCCGCHRGCRCRAVAITGGTSMVNGAVLCCPALRAGKRFFPSAFPAFPDFWA